MLKIRFLLVLQQLGIIISHYSLCCVLL